MKTTVPLAIVNLLAAFSAERAKLPGDKINVTAVSIGLEKIGAQRFAIETSAHWNEMVTMTSAMIQETDSRHLFVFFPNGTVVDQGIYLRPGMPAAYVFWRFDREPGATEGPNFAMDEIPGDQIGDLVRAEGKEIFQALLDRQILALAS